MSHRHALAAVVLVVTVCAPLAAQEHWVTTWAASPSQFVTNAPTISVKSLVSPPPEQTIRNIVHISLAGDKVRVRLSNALSSEPLVIPDATIALRAKDDTIDPATSHPLTFNGGRFITLPPGADAISDPVVLNVPSEADLAISLFTRGRTGTGTLHPLALQTSYTAIGDQTANPSLNAPEQTLSWPFLSEVEVAGPANASAVIALGDSITDGAITKKDTNQRWPDDLFRRLRAAHYEIGVGNAGIAGNRLLHDGQGSFGPAFGPSAIARFDRDVLALAGVRYMIVLLGINDIGQPGTPGASADTAVSAEQIEGALRQLVERAHVHGIRVMGGTLLPCRNAKAQDYATDEKEARRQAVNQWIRTSGAFDAVADFDAATRDPQHPQQMQKDLDGGDGLHPNAAGTKAMADSIPLDFFRK